MPNPNEYLAKESLLALKQDKLVAGDNITIDPITNRISAQTGAGTVTDVKVDNVSVVNASGIANVDLSGKQNTLTPGTNITIQNNVISATGGTEVEANPADPATDTLTTIDIDGTVYDIAGSGGSSVVPNPQGTPTDTLDSIEIDGDIYEVGSGNADYIELTQQEYNALTPAQQMDGTMYFITDGQNEGGDAFFYPLLYSETEREVGTWIDGKPLYQRTFDLSSTTFSDNNWNSDVLGTAGSGINIVYFDGYFGFVGENSRLPINYYRSNSTYFCSTTNDTIDDLSFRPNMNTGTTIRGDIVNIWYTKTADTPGSGKYNTLGVPTVHYDNTERIIGTWFGETLYEKTLDVTIDSTAYTIPNTTFIDTLISVEGVTTGNTQYIIPYADSDDYCNPRYIPSTGIRIASTSWFVNNAPSFKLTIRYTKSSS